MRLPHIRPIFLIDNNKKPVHKFLAFISNEQEAKVHKKGEVADPEREMLDKALGSLKESTGLNAQIDLPAKRDRTENDTAAIIGLSTEDHRWAFSPVIK